MLTKTVNICGDACKMFIIETNKFKVSSLSLLACVDGETADPAHEATLLGVLTRGTASYRTLGEINKRLDMLYSMSLGTRRHVYGSNRFISVSIDYLDKKYTYDGAELETSGVDMVRDLLFDPLFDSDGMFLEMYVESEKQNLINELNSRKNDTHHYASALCTELLTKDEEGFVSADELLERIGHISRRSLTDYYRKTFSAVSFVCFYVGNAPERAISAVSEMMLSLKREGRLSPLPERFLLTPPTIPESVSCLDVPVPVSQCKLSVGYKTPVVFGTSEFSSKDLCAVMLLNEIFGGCTTSKLFTNLRERQGLCYYCTSTYSMYRGIIRVNSGIDSANHEAVEAEIDAQLECIKNGEISTYELDNAKRSLRFSYTQITDNTDSLEHFYLWRSLFGGYASHTEVIDEIMSVTVGDVVRVAQTIVKAARVCIGSPSTFFQEGDEAHE